jgi:hypothetical protein
MLHIESLKKIYYCPLKSNRLINESGERGDDPRVDSLAWSAEDELAGKNVHLRGFPKGYQLKLFRWTLSTKRTDDVVTNDPAQLTGACACKDRSSGREHGCAAPCYLDRISPVCRHEPTG